MIVRQDIYPVGEFQKTQWPNLQKAHDWAVFEGYHIIAFTPSNLVISAPDPFSPFKAVVTQFIDIRELD